jgi:phage-related protein (TIGR01555 family)
MGLIKTINDTVRRLTKRSVETDSASRGSDGTITQTFTADGLYRKFGDNGFLQTIVTAPAHDATREGFDLKVKIGKDDDEADNSEEQDAIVKAFWKRWKELDLNNKRYEMIKFSRIYREGSGMYIGIDGGNTGTAETVDITTEIPKEIKKITFINVLEDPATFTLDVPNNSDPTGEDYGRIEYMINGRRVHDSRVIPFIQNFNIRALKGTSVVATVEKSIRAQNAALSGTKTVLERLGAILFKSESISLAENAAAKVRLLLTHIKSNLKSTGAMGLKPGDEASLLSHNFSNIKDVFDFIFSNMSGESALPQSILMGTGRTNIITGSGDSADLERYYQRVEAAQENQLIKVDERLVDLIFRETDSPVNAATKGKKISWEIEYNSLWSISDKEQAEVDQMNSERDKNDIEDGKVSPDEARMLDPRLSELPTTATAVPEGDE